MIMQSINLEIEQRAGHLGEHSSELCLARQGRAFQSGRTVRFVLYLLHPANKLGHEYEDTMQ